MTTLDNIQEELDKFLSSNLANVKEKFLIIHDKKKICYKYDLKGNFIELYKSISDAAKSVNVGKDRVRKTLKGELKTTAGYIFLYEKYDKLPDDILEERLKIGVYNRFADKIIITKKRVI